MPNIPNNFDSFSSFPANAKDVLDGTNKYLVMNIQGDRSSIPTIKDILVSLTPDIPNTKTFVGARLIIVKGIGQVSDAMPMNDGIAALFGNYFNPFRVDQPTVFKTASILFECQIPEKLFHFRFNQPLTCDPDNSTAVILTFPYSQDDSEAAAPALTAIATLTLLGNFVPKSKAAQFELGV